VTTLGVVLHVVLLQQNLHGILETVMSNV